MSQLFRKLTVIIAIGGLSTIVAAYLLLSCIPCILRSSWRLQATALAFLPFATVELVVYKTISKDWFAPVLYASLGYAAYNACISLALSLTTVPRATLLASMTPVILIVAKAIRKERISQEEYKGVFVVLIGGIITAYPSFAAPIFTMDVAVGDSLAFLSCCGLSMYAYFSTIARSAGVYPFLYSFLTTFLAAVVLTALSVFTEGSQLYFIPCVTHVHCNNISVVALTTANTTRHCNTFSVTEWFAADSPYLSTVLFMSIVPGILSLSALSWALKGLSPLFLGVCYNIEPVFAIFVSMYIGVSESPNIWSIAGGCVIITGCLIIGTSKYSTKVENIQKSG